MTKAFCPGHITCFFSPVMTDDVMTTGSLGAGIRLDKGVHVIAEERRDSKIVMIMDGKELDLGITKDTIRTLAPGTGFDITITNDIPVSQGLGASAAGAVAAGLCVASITDSDEPEAYAAAHASEVKNGGGLGDVAGILGGRQTIRVKAGIQPFGRTVDTGLDLKLTVAVFGGGIETKSILSDAPTIRKITSAGKECVSEYLERPTERKLYELSLKFMKATGLGTNVIDRISALADEGYMASMCMLGNSIFTNAPADRVRDILGNDAVVLSFSSAGGGPRIIHKA